LLVVAAAVLAIVKQAVQGDLLKEYFQYRRGKPMQ
jgi:hypothetical protein